ncbi:hypothetical protein HD806DRAFT_495045, partial [Xylariaceae sp. AK1471]
MLICTACYLTVTQPGFLASVVPHLAVILLYTCRILAGSLPSATSKQPGDGVQWVYPSSLLRPARWLAKSRAVACMRGRHPYIHQCREHGWLVWS